MSYKKFQQPDTPRGSSKDFFSMIFFIGSPVAFCKSEVMADKARVFSARIGVIAQGIRYCKRRITHALGF